MTHPDEAELSAFSLDPQSVTDREAVAAHVADCKICQEAIEAFRKFEDALRSAETWTYLTGLQSPSGRFAEAQELRRRVQKEDAEASRILAPLVNSPLRFRNAKLEEKPRCHTEGMVRMLCAAANERHESRPTFSLELTVTACTIAKALPQTNGAGRRLSMGMALRERANALRYLGKFNDALLALEYAERFFDTSPGADDFDLAIVWYIRAVVFNKSDRLAEGIIAARDAARVFREYGDRDRELSSIMVEAGCLLLSGNAQDAVEAFGRVADLARERSNVRLLASALQNGAAALADLGQLERAERLYSEAIVLYDELRVPTEHARAVWALGSVAVAAGNLEEGAARLDASRKELAHLGLTNDAAQATLEWAEARLALNKPEGVAAACRKIVVVFNSEGMQHHAKEALATLHEALRAGKATPELVRSVRAYLDQLPANPTQPFVMAS